MGAHVNRSVGVSYLMSAVGLSHDLRKLMYARRGMCFACRVLPIMFFGYKLLCHQIWYSYAYIALV